MELELRGSRRFIYDVYVDLVRQFNRTVQDEPGLIWAACLIGLGSFQVWAELGLELFQIFCVPIFIFILCFISS